MREHNLKTRIATGSATLPVAFAILVVQWITVASHDTQAWWGLPIAVVTTYLLMELNNRNALLRVRSRMVSATFVALLAAVPFLYHEARLLLPALMLAAAYFPLFSTYQKRDAAAGSFNAALLLSLGSIVWAPMLLLLIPIFIGLAVQLRSLSYRTFFGLVFGAFVPYWIVGGVALWRGDIDTVFLAFLASFIPDPITAESYLAMPLPHLVTCGFVVFFSLIAIIHFYRTAFNDKIKTRMYFDVFILVEMVLLIGLCAQPHLHPVLLPLLFVNSAPIIAHQLTLSRGRWANVWFAFFLVALVAILVYNSLAQHGVTA